MTPLYARAPRGQRAYAKTRRNYGKNVTLLSALRVGSMQAPMVIEGATTTAVFEAYSEHGLAPVLEPGDVVILDNLAAHKSERVRHLVEARGAFLLFLPAYSPDLSPMVTTIPVGSSKHFPKSSNPYDALKLKPSMPSLTPSLTRSMLFPGLTPWAGLPVAASSTWLSHPEIRCKSATLHFRTTGFYVGAGVTGVVKRVGIR